MTRVEAEFRASAGALVGAQLASADVDGADALARVAAAFPRLAREYDAFLLDVDAAATTTDAASTTTAAAEFARVTDARVVAAAGTARWLAASIARAPTPRPEAIEPGALAALAPLAPALGFAWGARPDGRGPHGLGPDGLGPDGLGPHGGPHGPPLTVGETVAAAVESGTYLREMIRAVVSAASRRWDAANAANVAGDSSASSRVAVATRDLAASTIGILESLLGDDPKDPTWSTRESATLDALADALRAGGDASPSSASISYSARAFVVDALLPGFLARETRDASQRRCARTWTSALGLCRRLLKAEEGGVEGDDAERLVSRTLAAPSAAMLDAVVGVGEMNHHAAAAVATLFDILAEQMERAVGSSGVSGERSAPTSAVAAPPAIGARGRRPRSDRRPRSPPRRSDRRPRSPPRPSPSLRFRFRSRDTRRRRPRKSAGIFLPRRARRGPRRGARRATPPSDPPRGPADASGARAPEEHTAEDERRRLDASRAAAAASLSTPAAARLLRASVAAAVASVAAAALAAPVAASSGGAFSSLGRSSDDAARRSPSRATPRDSSRRARSRARHGRVRSARIRAFRRRRRRRVRPASPGAVVRDGDGDASWASPRSVPRGSHRAAEAWTRPRERLAGVSAAGVRLLRAAQRAARVVDGAASLVAAFAAATQAAAALLREPEAAGYGPDIATLDDVLRAMRVETTRLPPRPGTVARGNREGGGIIGRGGAASGERGGGRAPGGRGLGPGGRAPGGRGGRGGFAFGRR